MKPVTTVTGRMAPLDRAHVDTDQIMPKQHLKRIERTGFGDLVFGDWRADPDFVLNDERYDGVNVLVTGPNFGSGSSREHAPWGLQQYGFDAIIAPSFADIFRNNCVKIGLLTVELPPERCQQLIDLATRQPDAVVHIDLHRQVVEAPSWVASFDMDPHTKHVLIEGLDAIDMTLQREAEITAFEATRPSFMPVAAAG
jgi:3-isopropylmalate/(R)-2-methylmalate dehydratase small subunit